MCNMLPYHPQHSAKQPGSVTVAPSLRAVKEITLHDHSQHKPMVVPMVCVKTIPNRALSLYELLQVSWREQWLQTSSDRISEFWLLLARTP